MLIMAIKVALAISMMTLSGVSTFVLDSVCGSHGHVNGCSIPNDWPYFYKDVFRPDCNKHDICYACGQMNGVSRSTCDSRFWSNLKTRCSIDSRVKNEVWCNMVTLDYYLAVRLGGAAHYVDPSPSWCHESWVNGCMN